MNKQEAKLLKLCQKDPILVDLFKACPQILRDYPWYVGASSIAATVWNDAHKFTPGTGVKDYDVAYFDPDLSQEKEQRIATGITTLFPNIKVDVVNQARAHLWYPDDVGITIGQIHSLEAAIDTWHTTSTAIGVRPQRVYAPRGLDDLFGLVIRRNTDLIDQPCYDKKTARWKSIWPRLNILPWGN